MEWLERTELLLGSEALARLGQARVALFGVGGVGGHCAEALIRSGIGALDLYDKDVVSVTNINRQLIATTQTIGMPKVLAMRERLLCINPQARIGAYQIFYLPETADQISLAQYTYIVDAVDTVTAKVELALRAQAAGIPIISAMGAGNKLNPALFRVADLSQTSVCPLARVMCRELKKRGVCSMKVVYSPEAPIRPAGASAPGSTAFCPSVAGLIMAGEVVRDLCGIASTPREPASERQSSFLETE